MLSNQRDGRQTVKVTADLTEFARICRASSEESASGIFMRDQPGALNNDSDPKNVSDPQRAMDFVFVGVDDGQVASR